MSTRRTFFKQLAGAAASFAILPAATTYERIWRPKLIEPQWRINPAWVNAKYEMLWGCGDSYLIHYVGEPIPDVPSRWKQLSKPVRFTSSGEIVLIPEFILNQPNNHHA